VCVVVQVEVQMRLYACGLGIVFARLGTHDFQSECRLGMLDTHTFINHQDVRSVQVCAKVKPFIASFHTSWMMPSGSPTKRSATQVIGTCMRYSLCVLNRYQF
jgi:hypothetical protein